MAANEILAILMFVSFIVLVFTGFPVACPFGQVPDPFTGQCIDAGTPQEPPADDEGGCASSPAPSWPGLAVAMLLGAFALLRRRGVAS